MKIFAVILLVIHASSSSAMNFIIGGTQVTGETAIQKAVEASTVALRVSEFGQDWTCSAVIIESDMVLTAGHCVSIMAENQDGTRGSVPNDADAIHVLFNSRTNPIWLEIKNVWVNPEFLKVDPLKKNNLDNASDIAVIQLKFPLPAGSVAVEMLPENTKMNAFDSTLFAGFGSSGTELSMANFKMKDPDFNLGEFTLEYPTKIRFEHGDSGGPVFYVRENHIYLAGVLSRKYSVSQNTIFSSALKNRSFITQTIHKLR